MDSVGCPVALETLPKTSAHLGYAEARAGGITVLGEPFSQDERTIRIGFDCVKDNFERISAQITA
jgi:hypothetical protein